MPRTRAAGHTAVSFTATMDSSAACSATSEDLPQGSQGHVALQQLGPLSFDPKGADFREWVNVFKDAVYKNWVVLPTSIEGFRGPIDLEFTVERDGSITSIQVLKPTGRADIDLLSERSLLAAAPFLPLPAAFREPRITMQVSFRYNEPSGYR